MPNHVVEKLVIGLGLCLVAAGCHAGADAQGQFEQTVMDHERAIGGCMEAAGWDYVPSLPADVVIERLQREAELVGETFDVADLELPPNPNEQIIRDLGDQEKSDWADAYWGDGSGGDGCYYETYQAAWGLDPRGPSEDALEAMEAALAQDPRVRLAESRYVSCLEAEGFGASGRDAFLSEVLSVPTTGERSRSHRAEALAAHERCAPPLDTAITHATERYLRQNDVFAQ